MIAHHLGKESLFIFYIPGICGQRQKKWLAAYRAFLKLAHLFRSIFQIGKPLLDFQRGKRNSRLFMGRWESAPYASNGSHV